MVPISNSFAAIIRTCWKISARTDENCLRGCYHDRKQIIRLLPHVSCIYSVKAQKIPWDICNGDDHITCLDILVGLYQFFELRDMKWNLFNWCPKQMKKAGDCFYGDVRNVTKRFQNYAWAWIRSIRMLQRKTKQLMDTPIKPMFWWFDLDLDSQGKGTKRTTNQWNSRIVERNLFSE